MDSAATSAITHYNGEHPLAGLVRGERARALRAQLARRHPRRSAEEIEDAVQSACRYFLDQGETISEPGPLYRWVRTVADRALAREDEHRDHELAVDPSEEALELGAADQPGPAEELIALEDEAELGLLVTELASSLSDRRGQILALWGEGLKRPEIAERLGISERAVKRDLCAVMEVARAALAREAGGGCEYGEPLVLRFACGLASAAEAERARLHLDRCGSCTAFSERLDAWREKAAALFPPVAVEGASPGALERLSDRVASGISSIKQQVLGGGVQLKQQAAASYSRAVDPAPLAAVRPGAVAAVVAGCLAVGSGTYCAVRGVDPLGAANDLIAGAEQSEPPASSPPQSAETGPATPSPTASETPVYEAAQAAPTPEQTEQAAPEYEPQPDPEPRPDPEPTPPPEQSFDPASPNYPAVEAESGGGGEATSAPRPAPVPAGSLPQFGGP